MTASRFTLAMARGRLFPETLSRLSRFNNPVLSVLISSAILFLIIVFVSERNIAKLASSFLLSGYAGFTVFFFLHTDARQIVFEFNDDNNGFRSSEIEIVLKPSPDFVIENISISPLVPISGNRFNLFYNVKNIGFDTAAILNNLFEGIWLTRDEELNEKTAILTSKPMDIDTSTFAVGDIKPRNRLLQLPDSVFGEFYIFIKADNGNKFCELPFEDNNLLRFGPFQVNMSPPKDLQITQTEVPASAEAGTQISIGYRLENKAVGSIPLTEIKDSIALFNNSDTIQLYSYKKERTFAGNSLVDESFLITVPYKTPPGNYKMAFFTA